MVIMLFVFVGVLAIVFAYGPLERHLIRKQIQKEFENLHYDFSYDDHTSQGLLVHIMSTRYLRRMEGIEKVAKLLNSSHKWRAQNELLEMWEVWAEEGRSFRMLRGKNLV